MFNEISYHNSAISSKNSHSYYWLNSYFCWLPQGKRAIHELSPWIITIIVPILSHINMDIVVNIGHTHIYIYNIYIYRYSKIRKPKKTLLHNIIMIIPINPMIPIEPCKSTVLGRPSLVLSLALRRGSCCSTDFVWSTVLRSEPHRLAARCRCATTETATGGLMMIIWWLHGDIWWLELGFCWFHDDLVAFNVNL